MTSPDPPDPYSKLVDDTVAEMRRLLADLPDVAHKRRALRQLELWIEMEERSQLPEREAKQ
jgi:hypothetical protein